MKFTLLLGAALVSCGLAVPLEKSTIPSRDESTIEDRQLLAHAIPHIDITVQSDAPSSREDARARQGRLQRTINSPGDLISLMDLVADAIKAKSDGISTALNDARAGKKSKYQAAHAAVRMVHNIRATLSGTVSGLYETPNMDMSQEERQQLLEHLYTITHEVYQATKSYVDELGSASGGRSLSRASHMLADMLDCIVTIDPDIVPDVDRALTPIFPGGVSHDELLNGVMSSMASFLSSIKVNDVDNDSSETSNWNGADPSPYSSTSECAKDPDKDCSNSPYEDLRS
ncbi:hypothetical protein FSARC_13787 [Fusarium sarcochroum]|uniref:Cell wall protein n=1 Tax=Fusarium sarcochroum TaxID=1208366 RepID=A0A8H4WSD3_9HYPO|nr:hypothetical protein FSARC_13787 [Fusarium sarcochroum]